MSLRARRLWLAGITFLSIVPLWLFRYVPMTDAPNHLLAAFIAVHYTDPRFSFARYFTLDLTPRSNILGHYIMILFLRLGVSPEATLRLLATLIVLATLWGLYALLRVYRGPNHASLWFPMGVLLAYTWFFHQGFLNFTLSVALALWTVALAGYWGVWPSSSSQPARHPSPWAVGILTGMLYLTYLAHAMGLAMALLSGGLLTLARLWHERTSPTRWHRWFTVTGWAGAPVLFTALLMLAVSRLSPNARGEVGVFLTPPFIVWAPLSRKIAELRYGLLSFAPWREQWILLPAFLLLLVGWIRTLRRPGVWHTATLVAFALYLALPMGFWVPFFIYERFWLFTLIFAVAALPNYTKRPWRLLVRGTLFVVFMAFLLNLTNSYRIANRDLQAYDEVLTYLPEGTWAFPFTYYHLGRVSPPRHFWAYAMMRKDVFIPMVFAEVYHPVQYRPDIPRPTPLRYEDGFFAEHARNRATLWVREDDPLMQAVVLPKLGRHGYQPGARIGPYRIYQLATWPPPVPPEARPHIRPEVAAAYEALLVYGYPPPELVAEIQQAYVIDVQSGLATLYRRRSDVVSRATSHITRP